MNDPLGLLPANEVTTPDPLGLLAAPVADPFAGQKTSQGRPDDEGWEGFKLPILDSLFWASAPERTAKSQNILAISNETGLPPSMIQEHYDEAAREQGLADQPKTGELFGGLMLAGALMTPLAPAVGPLAGWASMSIPLRYLQMAKGAATFQGVVEATGAAVAKIKGKEYKPLSGEGVSSLLPEDTAESVKAVVDLAEFVGQAYATGAAFKGASSIAERFMRETINEFGLPKNIYVSADKLHAHFGGRGSTPGQPGYMELSPEELAVLKDLKLSSFDYRTALKEGLDIEIPAWRLTTVQDRPWLKTIKELFKVSPYKETTLSMAGETTTGRPVAGLLGEAEAGAGQRAVAGDIVQPGAAAESGGRGILAGQRGSVATGEPASAVDRLKSDLAAFEAKAKEAGKDLAVFLKESGVNEAGIASMLVMKGLPKPDAIKQAFLAGKAPASEQVIDKDLFDNFINLDYIKTEKNGEVRYVRKEQTAVGNLDRDAIQARIDDGIARKRDDAARRSVAAAASATPYPPSNVTASEGASLRERGIAPQSPESLDDINAVFEMAARTDQAAGSAPTDAYDKIRAEAARLAFEAITKKIDLSRRKLARETARAAMDEVRVDPVYLAMLDAVQAGGMSRSSLAGTYDDKTITELVRKMRGLVPAEGGEDYTRIAAQHGFEYADDMIVRMLDWRGLKKEAGRYAEQYEDKYGDLLTQSELESFHENLLEEEAKILRRLLKQTKKPSAPGIKRVIREQTGQTRVDELVVSEYEALKAGMIKSERAARKAFRAGNIEGALAEKERQLEMAAERKAKLEAKEEARGIHDGLLALSKNKNIPVDYQDRIHDLLEDFDLLPRSKRTGARVESARDFLERQREAGEDVTIPESMLNRIERYGKVHWRELTLDQLREIYDQAKMYEHLGKLKNKLISRQEGREFEAVVEAIVTEVDKNWGVKRVPAEELERMFDEPTELERLSQVKESYLGSLTKVETYLRRLDKFKDLGPIHELIYMPTKRASDAEFLKLQEITDGLKALFDPIRETLTKEKGLIPGVKHGAKMLAREKVIMVALNSGNEGNLKALKENKVYGWGDAEIQAILANVTPAEWKLVRGVWDLFEKQWPALADVYFNLTGARLKKVDGEYFPLVFDRKLSLVADKNATEQELRDFFKSIYSLPSVKSGSVIERVGGKLPPKLSFQVIFDKLSEVNHYITHAEAVRDVQKILADPRVRAAVEGAPDGVGGVHAYREMKSWLQDVSRQRQDPVSAVEAMFKTLRINATTVAMAWKFSTAAMQWLGASNSIYKTGGAEFAGALAEFYTNRGAMVERIKGMSPEVAGRAKSFDRDLRDAYKRLGLEHFRGSQAIKDSFFSLISLMDMAVAYPTWLAAYNKGIKDFAGNDTKAVEYADMTLRMTQGAGLVKDLAGIQRGAELKKMVSLFYTYFSAYHQMMGDAWLKFKFDKSGANVWDLMKAWWWLTILPATMEYMLKERDVPTPGKFIANVLQQRLTAYPVIRDITGAMLTDYDYQMTPVAKAGEVMARAGKEAWNITPFSDDEVEWDKLFRYSLESAGYLKGLPTGQAAVTMQGLIDLWNGDTSDPTRLLMRQPRGDRVDDVGWVEPEEE